MRSAATRKPGSSTLKFILTDAALALLICAALGVSAPRVSAQKAKLPKPQELGAGLQVQRDMRTGELRLAGGGTAAAAAPGDAPDISHAIRASVAMVSVGATVLAPNGEHLRGLKAGDFRLYEDGLEQGIASFDAASTPASIAVIIDASPSIMREFGDMREAAKSLARALNPEDDVAVVTFADRATLLLPFSRDRDLLAKALASPELTKVADSSQSYIYRAVFLTARELFPGRRGRKAILLLTDGQDSGLGLSWDPQSMRPRANAPQRLAFDDVARELAAQGIELYVISTENRPKIMTDAWLTESQGSTLVTPLAKQEQIPQYTLYLAELERQAGGGIYFLRETGGLAEVYHRIALGLSAEYTLGFYPVAGVAPGWHQLRVELRRDSAKAPAGAQVIHRTAYFVPPNP